MCVLGQQGALLLFLGPYGRMGGLPCSSTPPSVLPRNSVTKNKMPVALSQTDENLKTQLISTSQCLLKATRDIFWGGGGGAIDPVQEMNEGKCCWDHLHSPCIKKTVLCSPQVVNRRAKILQAKPSGHHGNPTLVKALGSKEAWGVLRRYECRLTVIYCTQTHHKFKNLRSSSSSSTIIKCVLVSVAIKAELRHHFLPHAAATFSVFNCPQLSRSHTDL